MKEVSLSVLVPVLFFAGPFSQAQDVVVLDDFESSSMTQASIDGNNTASVHWEDLDLHWAGRNNGSDTPDWQIVDGLDGKQLQLFDADNRNTQCATAFSVSFEGRTGGVLEFDAPFGANWNDIDIYLGIDDGDNVATDRIIEGAKTNGTLFEDCVSSGWVHVINNGWDSVDTYQVDLENHVTIDLNAEGNLPADLASYNLLVIRFQSLSDPPKFSAKLSMAKVPMWSLKLWKRITNKL